MSAKAIRVRGARTHNLRDLDLDLPREALTVVCGVSGSGKSSLVLDTLGAESRRRFLGTSSRPPRGLVASSRPDVDRIEGLPPAVVAGFTAREPGPRRTLGTVTEVTHALRALFARAALPHCPTCGTVVDAHTPEEATAALLDLPQGSRIVLLAPRGRGPKALEDAARDGFVRVRAGGGTVMRIEDLDPATVNEDARVEVVVDRLVVKGGVAERFASSVDQGLDLGGGVLCVLEILPGGEEREATYADRPYCGDCELTWPPLSTATFSFNRPAGACPTCEGRGEVLCLDPEKVLPRHVRLERAAGHLARHLTPDEGALVRRRIEDAARRAGLSFEGRVLDLPENVRTRLLEGGRGRRGPGLLRMLEHVGRKEALASSQTCPDCGGQRLGPFARSATVSGATLPDLEALSVEDLEGWLAGLEIHGVAGVLAAPALEDALTRLRFLREVGLGYLAPARAARSLSGGELRRARLAAACAARMSGLLFLLDEPTAGLHPADRPALVRRLRSLVDEGNTVVCVEHDPALLLEADHVVELGPGPGAAGGRVVAEGSPDVFLANDAAATTRSLRARPASPQEAPRRRRSPLRIRGARRHNLTGVNVEIPQCALTCFTGVSGAGKSTLLLEVLAPAARSILDRGPFPSDRLDALEGLDTIERIGVARGVAPRHPRATPGSVLGVLSPLRRLFASTLDARTRGWASSRFSRHVAGGRCEVCKGTGERRVALRDLDPVRVTCDACNGAGFNRDTLKVRVKGLSIADVLALPLEGAATLFRDIPTVVRPLSAATEVGLGYVPLGEPTSHLSGGEALRLRLAAALGRGGHTPTLYLLDEPSASLHPADVAHLATVLLKLAEAGNTVVAVEHDLHLVRLADHVVELGPGPGEAGGRIVYQGPPAGLLDGVPDSPTARALLEEDARQRGLGPSAV